MFKRVGNTMVNLSQIIFVELEKNKILLTPATKAMFSGLITITSNTEREAKEIFEKLVKDFGGRK